MKQIFSVLVVLAFAAGVAAQEVQAPDPSKEIAALKQQNAQLQQQNAQLSQKTPAELTKAAQEGYAAVFKEGFEKAEPGCKAAKGHTRVAVVDGKVSISCER